ncbi:hypothetical protein GN956_G6430 [Arapaima gigas]
MEEQEPWTPQYTGAPVCALLTPQVLVLTSVTDGDSHSCKPQDSLARLLDDTEGGDRAAEQPETLRMGLLQTGTITHFQAGLIFS